MNTNTELAPAPEINKQTNIFGAPEGHDARILANKARDLMPDDRVLMHIALDDRRVESLIESLKFFAPEVDVIYLPAWDCLPYDRVSPNNDIIARRVSALCGLIAWQNEKRRKPRILLTTVNAAIQRVMPQDILDQARLDIAAGGRLEISDLQSFLNINGYMRTDTVREAGEYAIRGGIIDLFPSGFENPVRIDLFGDEVESMKYFDAETQRSLNSLKELTLHPATEFFLDEDSISRFRAGYRDHFGTVQNEDPLYESISAGRQYNGAAHWLPLFYDRLETIFDYVGNADITFDHQASESHDERIAQIRDFYEARRTLEKGAKDKNKKAKDVSLSGAVYHPLPVKALYIEDQEWAGQTGSALHLSPFKAPDQEDGAKRGRDFADIRSMPDGDVFAAVKEYIHTLSLNPLSPGGRGGASERKMIITAISEGSKDRLKGLLEHANIGPLKDIVKFEELKKLKSGHIGLTILELENGFVAPDLAIITEQDILGDRLARKSSKKRKADNFLKEVSSLDEGDLVVHLDHGIGRFIALETVKAGKTLHDCLKIEYAGGDRLFVPVENIEVLSRYGADEGTVQLDKLGGAGWQARKARAKEDLMKMADQLLKIAAKRQLQKAEKLDVDAGVYNEFSARFPYAETEDQQRAIDAAVADLAQPYPMDRLVCGDVGFGKTEVAMRAAYVAAMSGAQVAIVVPTTLLARQHYKNFLARFQNTGLRVEQLSRMVTAKDAKMVKEGLADGSVNIVIGTHALFGKGISFNHLGLLIVDEEQRFGVKQKERLKELKSNVHVLTLTATPIPRTLQMSLTGVKDLSLITTPPVDRLAVRTFILPFDGMVIREALMREHYRGGQSFYVCPRIKDMKDLEDTLKDLVPELKIVTAHGQMPPTDLDDRMTAFYDGQYDILLATNIIESGIDIPTANTMIIHRADMFGLAQLYQIRGRIGRSKQRAYAYLTYPPRQKLTDQAQKRLEVMETLDTLGAGFQLASYDMDIRGAGNLLGEQQSGHIKEIGVELYQQMLEEAVASAKEGDGVNVTPSPSEFSPQINIGTSVLIPESYVEDLGVRMSLYRRLAELEGEEDIESFAAELIDRFGKLPAEVNNLLDIVSIKQLCKKAGISSVEAGPKGAVIGFYKDAPPNVEGLMRWISERGGSVKLRPDQKLVIVRGWEDLERRVKGVRSIAKELADLI